MHVRFHNGTVNVNLIRCLEHVSIYCIKKKANHATHIRSCSREYYYLFFSFMTVRRYRIHNMPIKLRRYSPKIIPINFLFHEMASFFFLAHQRLSYISLLLNISSFGLLSYPFLHLRRQKDRVSSQSPTLSCQPRCHPCHSSDHRKNRRRHGHHGHHGLHGRRE